MAQQPMHWSRRSLLCAAVAGWAGSLHSAAQAADLRVLHDAGGGVPYEQWLGLSSADEQAQAQTQTQTQTQSTPGAWMRFPIRTPGLRAGKLARPRQWPQAQWLTQPVVVVGSDPASRRWLIQHRDTLETMGARGIVAECPSEAAFAALQMAAGALPLAPLMKAWLVTQLKAAGAAVLPLLITADGRITQHPTVIAHRSAHPSGGQRP